MQKYVSTSYSAHTERAAQQGFKPLTLLQFADLITKIEYTELVLKSK